MKYTICNDTIRQRIPKPINVLSHIIARTVSDILIFHIFYLENLGQCHGVTAFTVVSFDNEYQALEVQ